LLFVWRLSPFFPQPASEAAGVVKPVVAYLMTLERKCDEAEKVAKESRDELAEVKVHLEDRKRKFVAMGSLFTDMEKKLEESQEAALSAVNQVTVLLDESDRMQERTADLVADVQDLHDDLDGERMKVRRLEPLAATWDPSVICSLTAKGVAERMGKVNSYLKELQARLCEVQVCAPLPAQPGARAARARSPV